MRLPRIGRPTDEQLMLAAGRGSREAFGTLVDRHHEHLLGLLTWLTGDPEMAKDLTQECFLKMLRAAPRYEPRAKFRTWLTTIARRLAIDAGSKAWERRVELTAEPAAAGPGPDEEAERRDRMEKLAGILAGLPPQERDALVLSAVGGLSYREIGELAGVPEGTVASRKHRAARYVRKQWRDRYQEETA